MMEENSNAEKKSIKKNSSSKNRHFSRDDAINQHQLQHLLQICERTEDVIGNKYLVSTMGILGMREGEVLHMKRSWVDFEQQIIHIPLYDPCDCTYCCRQMKGKLGRKNRPTVYTKEMVAKEQWRPKTNAGARTIPYGFNPETVDALREFFARFEKWPLGSHQMARRIKHLGKLGGIHNLHPHALRSTAATQFASDGMTVHYLMRIMGWDTMDMAIYYVNKAGIDLKRHLEDLYRAKKTIFGKGISYRVFCLSPAGKKLLIRKRTSKEARWLMHNLTPKEDGANERPTKGPPL